MAVTAKKPAKKTSTRKKKLNPKTRAKIDAKKNKTAIKLDMPKKIKGLQSRFVEFDGPLAQTWIDHDKMVREKNGTSNRKLTKSNVKAKKDCMLNDAFMTTSQGITVDWNTAIIDGQHTLHAIVAYYNDPDCDDPKPVKIYVTEGEDPANFPFYDQGKTRSNEDVFGMAQLENPKELAVASRLLWIRVNGKRVSGAGKLSPYALIEFSKDYKLLSRSLKFIMNFGREKNEDDRGNYCKSFLSEGYAAALHYLMVNADGIKGDAKKLADQFWDLLINPEKKSPLAPCVLHRKLVQVKNDPEKKMTRDGLVDNVIEAFNRFVDKKTGPFRLSREDRPQLGGYDGSQAPNDEE